MKPETRKLIEDMRQGTIASNQAAQIIRHQEDQIAQLRHMMDVLCAVVECDTPNGAQSVIPEGYLDKDGNIDYTRVASYARVVIRMTESAN